MNAANKTDRVLNVRDPGGPFEAAYTVAYYEPFEKETGIRIQRKEGGQEPSELIKDMVERQDFAWDVALTSQSANLAATLGTAPWLEDISGIAAADAIPEDRRSAHFQGDNFYAGIFAYRNGTFAGEGPRTWADFWDVDRFPCRRSMRRFPMDMMEAALLADGVRSGALYPLDVERAFSKMNAIRDHIDYWWTSGGEQQFLLIRDQVDMCAITSLRAVEAIRLGADVCIVWDGNIRTCQGWGILRGTPRADLARVFLEFVASADRQAELCRHVGVSPSIPAANDLIPAERRAVLPDGHVESAVRASAEFWSRNKPVLIDSFEQWAGAA